MKGRWLLTFILAASLSVSAWAFSEHLERSATQEGAAAAGSLLVAESAGENCYWAAKPSGKQNEAAKKKSKSKSKAQEKKSSAKLKPKLSEKERKVVLHGTRNTRELGGLPAADGKYVKEGVIYRSGALCYINDSDVEILKDKGIVSVIELRTPKEITSEGRDKPSFAGSVKKIYNLPMVCTSGRGGEAYASYLKKQNYSSISQFFKVLAKKDSYPVLFHCSAGKDRTGILTALVLELLRVPRPIIMDDYLASQRSSKGLKVEADWLRVVFKNIDKAGGIEPFLHSCGVSTADMKKVRENLLVGK